MLNKLFPENKGKYNERVCNLKEGVTLISLQMAINNSREFSTPNENKIFEEFIKLVLSDEEYEEAFSFMDRRKITFPPQVKFILLGEAVAIVFLQQLHLPFHSQYELF